VKKRDWLALEYTFLGGYVKIPYLRFQEMKESDILARFDQVWDRMGKLNADYSEEEISADTQEARQE